MTVIMKYNSLLLQWDDLFGSACCCVDGVVIVMCVNGIVIAMCVNGIVIAIV